MDRIGGVALVGGQFRLSVSSRVWSIPWIHVSVYGRRGDSLTPARSRALFLFLTRVCFFCPDEEENTLDSSDAEVGTVKPFFPHALLCSDLSLLFPLGSI